MNSGNKNSVALWRLPAGLAASAALLTVIHPPVNLHFLAWVAWVPFVLACKPTVPTGRLIFCAYAAAFAYWLFNLSWLWPVTGAGYIVFALWQSVYWPVLALTTRFVRKKQWPMVLFVPIIMVGAEAIQGILFTGFNWFFLSHSQYRILPLIQISDIFGAVGVSALVAMVNGLIADGLLRRRVGLGLNGRFAIKAGVAAVLLAATVGYGFYRIHQTPAFVSDGPLLGSVQPNVPSHVKEEIENAQKILDELIVKSQACIDAGAALVAWPETMVLAAMNREYLAYLPETSEPHQFKRQILDHADGQAYVLFGAHSATVGQNLTITDQYNTAFLYHPDGRVDPKRYDKVHLVPFGEYIPFRRSAPWLYNLILNLSPYDYDYNLTPGSEYTLFTMRQNASRWRFGVLICYEDTHPTIARMMTVAQNGAKRVDFLVNLSNDGWYVRFRDGKVIPSAELSQRLAISVFRCIENRVAIIRSVNTGISCLIDSTGQIRDGYTDGNLPERASRRQGVEGWFVDTIPIDRRVTFFSRFGRWLETVFGAALVGLFVWEIAERFFNRPKRTLK